MDFGDPRAAMASTFEIIYGIGMWPLGLNLPVYWIYYRSARGTRLRYITKSCLPPLIILGVFVWSCRLIADVLTDRPWYSIPIDAMLIAMWIASWAMYKKDSDDDFWNGLGGRIRRRLAVRRRSLATA